MRARQRAVAHAEPSTAAGPAVTSCELTRLLLHTVKSVVLGAASGHWPRRSRRRRSCPGKLPPRMRFGHRLAVEALRPRWPPSPRAQRLRAERHELVGHVAVNISCVWRRSACWRGRRRRARHPGSRCRRRPGRSSPRRRPRRRSAGWCRRRRLRCRRCRPAGLADQRRHARGLHGIDRRPRRRDWPRDVGKADAEVGLVNGNCSSATFSIGLVELLQLGLDQACAPLP